MTSQANDEPGTDETDAVYFRAGHYALSTLRELGAVDTTLAMLWDLVDKTAGPLGVTAALAARRTQT